MTKKMNNEKPHHELQSVSRYVKVFFVLLGMIFLNMAISRLPLPAGIMNPLLLLVAITQTIIVALFFMELIHEDKFYSFIFMGTIFFILLFFVVCLLELGDRDFFTPLEGPKMMRQVDQNGNFAPEGPKWEAGSKSEHKKE